jgi:hypothetical protein
MILYLYFSFLYLNSTILKNIITILLAFFVFSASAQVIIVDNNGNAPAGVETSLSTAITNATAGDTILVIPSSSTYGNINISKELTIIGVGFNPDMDIPFTSTVGNVTIQNVASGTKIIGLNITSALTFGNTSGSLSNIVVENNYLNYISYSGISSLTNVLIRQNVIRTTFGSQSNIFLSVANQSNIIVSNNIFSMTATTTSYRGPQIGTGGVTFDHNTFMGASNQYAFYQLVNCLVTNNIFVTISPSSNLSASQNVLYRNNLANASGAFTGLLGLNISTDANIEDSPVFVNLPLNTVTYAYDLDPTLTTGPGENAALDGTNIGADGGTSPFKLTGSTLPVVKRFDLPANILEGNNANATIEVTGN